MSGRRIVVLCAVALALFSTLYSLAAWYDWWPRLPPGALHDTDLWAGFAGAVALLLVLLLDRVRRNGSNDEGSRNRAVGEGLAPPAPTS
jgi:hypothetical protein